MTTPDDVFADLTARFQHGSALVGAFHAEHHRWLATTDEHGCDGDSTDVVRRAWQQLSPAQQAAEMDTLLNAFYHHTMHVTRQLALAQMAADHKTYLQDGDLSIIEDTLSGASLLSDQPLDDQFPGGMLPVHVDVLQRLVSELQLLRFRLSASGGS